MENLDGKCVVLGVTGGIAAYKMANVASGLRKAGADVHVIMTENATQFITPLTFETLTNNRCVVDTFARDFKYEVTHISLAKAADLIMIAPATANVIAKMAHGIADDMLTTVVLAAKCKKLVSPAMNTAMLENPITQDNLATLKKYGFGIIEPSVGMLACKDVGSGKLPEPEVLCEEIYQVIAREKDLQGLHITVTAGPTQESLDPVRKNACRCARYRDRRPDAGIPRSGAVSDEPQQRPHGIRDCAGGDAPRRAGDADFRPGFISPGSGRCDATGDDGEGHAGGGAGDIAGDGYSD